MTNSTIPNDDISNPMANDTSKDDISPVTDSPNIHTPSPSPMNEDFSNSTMGEGDDESILDTIESLPVPAIASVGAVILIMIIVVTILLIVCCRMKRSSKNGMFVISMFCYIVVFYSHLMNLFTHHMSMFSGTVYK